MSWSIMVNQQFRNTYPCNQGFNPCKSTIFRQTQRYPHIISSFLPVHPHSCAVFFDCFFGHVVAETSFIIFDCQVIKEPEGKGKLCNASASALMKPYANHSAGMLTYILKNGSNVVSLPWSIWVTIKAQNGRLIGIRDILMVDHRIWGCTVSEKPRCSFLWLYDPQIMLRPGYIGGTS